MSWLLWQSDPVHAFTDCDLHYAITNLLRCPRLQANVPTLEAQKQPLRQHIVVCCVPPTAGAAKRANHPSRHIASHQFHRLESIWRQSFGQADDPAVMSPLDGLRKLSEQFSVAPTRSSWVSDHPVLPEITSLESTESTEISSLDRRLNSFLDLSPHQVT